MNNKSYLIINSGSSSLKFCLFIGDKAQADLTGIAERLSTAQAEISWQYQGEKSQVSLGEADHALALKKLFSVLTELNLFDSLSAIGHRVVHGGEYFKESALITPSVLNKIEACSALAPLHNPAAIVGINAVAEQLPDIAQVAVFDTAFHQTMPEHSFLYGLPYELYESQGIRKYGFHGTSHQYVAGKAIEVLGLDKNNSGVITAHLGNGCSISAVQNGLSVDTSMGFTPLEGVMMGTRSGDIDPSIHQFLADKLNLSLKEITDMLNKRSGLLGLSGSSNDMRTLSAKAADGDKQAALAIEVFAYRLAKSIASMVVGLNRFDALVFTGGIGENSFLVRGKVINHLAVLGFELDQNLNNQGGDTFGIITTPDSRKAIIVQTQEEWVIAQDTIRLTAQA
ncbi:acetate kinase [Catenovulum sp. 2E275]|uniref:acetate/propionate family kinase n=1 Tax=Catenovulum sp. 2E275 TaxID=2980497 RepID=UPI0021D341F2|nr:acetate kinase [Catenovulum sp. 2E275]MCU4675233.1 acetate kinase [Catenovulum sp. 2E275]